MGGGNCLKYLKGWNGKERRGRKDFKMGAGGGGKLGQGVGLSASKLTPFFMVYVLPRLSHQHQVN